MKVITILSLFAYHAVVVSGSSSLLRGNASEQDNTDGGEKNRKVIPHIMIFQLLSLVMITFELALTYLAILQKFYRLFNINM